MKAEHFSYRSRMPFSADEVFRWHERPGAFERLTPPWEKVRVLERSGGIEDGSRVVLSVPVGLRWRRWVIEHHDYQPGRQFRGKQREGPFARWEHRHHFVPDGANHCYLEDEIEYALPFGWPGRVLGSGFVRNKLERLFRYRHEVTARDLALQQRYGGDRPLRVLVTGSTGMVGSALVPLLTTGGHQVVRLVRSRDREGPDAIYWNPAENVLDPEPLEGFDAVVHLAGESIAARRWSAEQKERIRASRVGPTSLLCRALARLRHPPGVLVAASAIGYYGDRGDTRLDETSASGGGFLADVCRAWEAATEPASATGVRVVNLRLGVVLSPAGGALAKMLTPFRLGVAGRIGSGRQFMSWIALDDVLGVTYHAMSTPAIRGPVNAVAPNAVTNYEFTKTLGRVLRRPTFLPMPAFAARLAFGKMANELLLASTRVEPRTLAATDYPFQFRDLEPALRHLLGRETGTRHDAPADPNGVPAAVLAGK